MADNAQAAQQIVSGARRPRGLVKVNGQVLPAKTPAGQGWTYFEVTNTSYREAGTFRVCFALSGLPSSYSEAWFASQTTIGIELFAGFPVDPTNYGSSELQSLILGNVDSVEYKPAERILELSGRDLASLLIDAKTAEKWQNQTASGIAKTLAARHGLTPVVTATTDKMGRFYQIDHVNTTTAQTEWDFLCWIAQQTQNVVYVKGNELHFEPAPDPATAPQYPVFWVPATESAPFQSNAKTLGFSRTLTVGKTITVTVRSWNQKQAKGFTATYPTNHAKGIRPGSATEPAQNYSYVIGNLTQQQAIQRAQAIYNEIIKNEMRMTASFPGDGTLDVAHVIPVSGTGTAFDQTYYPETIIRRMTYDGGYSMDVTARNHSNDVEPAI